MKRRSLSFPGGKKGKSIVGAAVVAVAAGVFAMSALAVHDLSFQLDGDVSASTTTNVGGNTQSIDWGSLFNSSGGDITPLPLGFTATSFDKDFSLKANGAFNPADEDIFTTGSKDELPISGWQCKASNNVTDKNDIMNAYSAAFTAPNGDRILYFGLEKNDNTGTNDVGFWFLQDGTVDCDGSLGTATFSGAHVDGDLLVVSEFSNGGVVSTIKVYRWNGGANGSLDVANPIAEGVDCENTDALDEACATVNRPPDGAGNGTITTPWPTADKTGGPGNTLRTGEFFEGGLNLTRNNLAGKCFNTFLADTRASTSTTSDLEDFSLGTLGACTSNTVTDPVESDGTTALPDPPDGPQIPQSGTFGAKDKATVTVEGVSTFNGTLTFHICGPIATGTCDTGGTQIGGAQAVTSTPFTTTSDLATITEAGRYCWRADFSGDSNAGVPPSSDSRASECFVIKPRPTTVVTQAGPAGTVDFGNPVTDTATLSNTANRPGSGGGGANGSINPTTPGGAANGTISFTLFKENCTTLATGTGQNPQSVTVSGDGTYGPVSFTPDAPGTYHWVAVYSGDPPNTLASDSPACGVDPNETVIVRQIPTTISTAQSAFPNDSATVTSSVAGDNLPGGTVQFRLFESLASCQAGDNAQNVGQDGLLYKESKSVLAGANSRTVSTTNTSVAVSASTTVYWLVTYDTGDTAHTDRKSDCAESTVLTFTNDDGPGEVATIP